MDLRKYTKEGFQAILQQYLAFILKKKRPYITQSHIGVLCFVAFWFPICTLGDIENLRENKIAQWKSNHSSLVLTYHAMISVSYISKFSICSMTAPSFRNENSIEQLQFHLFFHQKSNPFIFFQFGSRPWRSPQLDRILIEFRHMVWREMARGPGSFPAQHISGDFTDWRRSGHGCRSISLPRWFHRCSYQKFARQSYSNR